MRTTTLKQIGASLAIIIPAKILKEKGYDKNTLFGIEEHDEQIIITPQRTKNLEAGLPKLKTHLEITPEFQQFYKSVKYSREETDNDPRLKAILQL